MTAWFLGFAMYALAPLYQGPPPPEVGLVRLAVSGVDTVALERSEATLMSLTARRYVTLRQTPLKSSDFDPCLGHGAETVRCIEQTLSRLDARPGDIVLLVQPADEGFQWTCIGAPVRAFEADRQVFRRIFRARTDDNLTEVFSRASACLTYAGHQSGW